MASEAVLVAAVGRWIGERVFGEVGRVLAARAPVVVRVVVPEAARVVAFRPLELATVEGQTLAVHGVTLVMQIGDERSAGVKRPVGARLRMLGLFSLPEGGGGGALNLRRERFELARLVHAVAAVHGRGVELRVLQYGVTRDRLRQVIREGAGWDIVHISGHGGRGAFVLEHPDGSPDPVSSSELVGLLAPVARQVKLVTASACSSAELTAREHLRLLGLSPPSRETTTTEGGTGGTADGGAASPTPGAEPSGGQLVPALASALVDRLDCAVLGMRFPVIDDFAIALNEQLYGLVVGQGQPLPAALGLTLPDLVADPPTPACPALSAGTPALFGARAVDLVLHAPSGGPLVFDSEQAKLSEFPDQPLRFVGRVRVMARANAALAERSGHSGVLFYGMAGAGKTACALELAYTQEENFRVLVWHKAPDEGTDITTALTDLALALERKLPGLKLAHLLTDTARLRGFLPTLTQFLERSRVLLVVDNIESLLTEAGKWRDERWNLLIDALTGQSGLSRVVMTSRRRLAHIDERLLAEPVHALSRDEAVLLARDLPNLGALITGRPPDAAGVAEAGTGHITLAGAAARRELAVRVLLAAQGHPKLLELADAQASNPERLSELLGAADREWEQRGITPDGLFSTVSGEPTADAGDYAAVLDSWARQVAAALPEAAQVMFSLLCCLEENDRIWAVIQGNWADLWQRLELPGDTPDPHDVLEPLTAQGLLAADRDTDGNLTSFRIHPGVAAAGRAQAGDAFQAAVDYEAATYWYTIGEQALKQETEEETGWLVVRAGRSAVPYLLRLHERSVAISLLERVIARDSSPSAITTLLPVLRQMADMTKGTADEIQAGLNLAIALKNIDLQASQRQLRDLLAAAVERADYTAASIFSTHLINNCRRAGQLTEALELADQMAEYTRRAGFGPWTQLADKGSRLQILAEQGHADQVLIEATRLQQQMADMPHDSGQLEVVDPFNVREGILDIGRDAARQLGRWEDSLAINGEIVKSLRGRGASDYDICQGRFNDYVPLLRLGRIAEARGLLLECRAIDERERDIGGLGKDLSALAEVEDEAGRGQVAIDLQSDALRYKYLVGEVATIAISHNSLGNYLARYAADPRRALAHHLASALLRALTGHDGADHSAYSAAIDLALLSEGTSTPATIGDLCDIVGQVPGVRLDSLLGHLTSEPEAAQRVLDGLFTQVRAAVAEVEAMSAEAGLARHLAAWDPVIAGIIAAAHGNGQAKAAVEQHLAERQDSADWGKLAAVLGAIVHGERGEGLLEGLDEIDTAITRRALAALSEEIELPVPLWQAIPIAKLIVEIVDAANGDLDAASRVREVLTEWDGASELSPLAAALRRIVDGERDPSLTDGLDPVGSAVVTTIQSYLFSSNPPKR